MRTGNLAPEEIRRATIATVIVVAIVWAIGHFSVALTPALKFFDLTPQDAQMIPCFFLAFFLIVRLLGYTIFRPYMALTQAREDRTIGAIKEAVRLDSRAGEMEQNFEQRLLEVRIDALRDQARKLMQAKQEARVILTEAENQNAKMVEQARAALSQELHGIKSDLSRDSESLSNLLAQRFL